MNSRSPPEAFMARPSQAGRAANGASPSSNSNGSVERVEHSGERRVTLACHRCRAKRGRCSGEKPVCNSCAKVDAECTWPEGRRRKRTRKEMEEEERLEGARNLLSHAESRSTSVGVQHREQHYPPPPPPPPQPPSSSSSSSRMFASQDHSVSPTVANGVAHGSWDVDRAMAPPVHNPSTPMWTLPPLSNSPSVNHPAPWLQSNPSSSGSGLTGSPQLHSHSHLHSQHHQPHSHPSPSINAASYLPLSPDPSLPRHPMPQHTVPSYSQSQDDDGQGKDLELYYYRFSGQPGSTAISPGINRISLRLQARAKSSAGPVPESSERTPHAPETTVPPEEMFDEHGLPLPQYHIPLLDVFFKTLSRHFPSISRKRMEERLETGTMSAFLLNCICAISARFADGNANEPAKACASFITKAQELIVPLLHLPTTDVVTGLLLLAWANYGQNSESGMWQYSGMAIRMALDLGIHEISEIYESSAHVTRTRLLFWSLFITDRILAFNTGRPPSLPEDIIEIPFPSDEDFFPDPAWTNDPAASNELPEPVPFHYIARLMVICGRIARVLNGRRGRPRTLGGLEDPPGTLSTLQTQLVDFHAGLPDSLKWSVGAFKHQEERGHGGTFLTLHLWANAVMALTYHPELTRSPLGADTPLTHNMVRSVKVALQCSKTISDCLMFADVSASKSYLASPCCVQPIYIASLAYIHDNKPMALPLPPPNKVQNEELTTADALLKSFAMQNLATLTGAMQRMDHYWESIAYVSNMLEQRAAALGYMPIDRTSRAKRTFIALPDQGLLHRFTNPDLPFNTAPPTETSLRASMAKEALEQSQQNYPLSMDELLASYSIGELFVQPAGTFDLEQLLTM
ncbi:fungal-specific transcription factor domain-containing protein [Amylostereum chailletii]|nr:fungal-specific transcription factor domain-containing protein [Amylostereum chailletii]